MKPPTREQLIITEDLSRTLRDRLYRCFDDYTELCYAADMPIHLSMSQGLAAILDVACRVVSSTTTTTPFQFGEMCIGAYRIYYNQEKKEKRNV